MKLYRFAETVLALVMTISVSSSAFAQVPGTEVYNNLPSPIPPNITALGFEATRSSEFGDLINLEASTPRRAGFVTVLMSTWALHSQYPNMPADGYQHLISLSIYSNPANARAGFPIASATQMFKIPWRPQPDSGCGSGWKAEDGLCYYGKAFTIVFDLRSLNVTLPEQFIFGVAFNTNTAGYNPLSVPGPYDSLNVGTSSTSASAGVDLYPDEVYWNTQIAGYYFDGGADGVGVFRRTIGWTGYAPAVSFTTLAVPTSVAECKNGAWANMMRPNASLFKGQGPCIAWVNTGK